MSKLQQLVSTSTLTSNAVEFLDRFATVLDNGVIPFGFGNYKKTRIASWFEKLQCPKPVCKQIWKIIGNPNILMHRTSMDAYWNAYISPNKLFEVCCRCNTMQAGSLSDAVQMVLSLLEAFDIMGAYIDDGTLVYNTPKARDMIGKHSTNDMNMMLIEKLLA